MLMNFRSLCASVVAVWICFASGARGQDLMITGVMDGTLSLAGGGSPKVVELYAINAIPNLSLYALSRAPNGNPTFDVFTSEYVLPSISLGAGQFYYAVGNSFNDMTVAFDAIYPAKTGLRTLNFGVNSNGNDATGLFYHASGDFVGTPASATMIDVVGAPGVDGTGTPWEHLDSWLYSKDGRTPSATFDVNSWSVGGINLLDNLTPEQIAESFPDETFVAGGGPSFSPADFDQDGFVDTDDLATWKAAYGVADAGDANEDEITDGADFLIWQREFTGSAPPVALVPEPAALAMALLGVVASVAASRRRA